MNILTFYGYKPKHTCGNCGNKKLSEEILRRHLELDLTSTVDYPCKDCLMPRAESVQEFNNRKPTNWQPMRAVGARVDLGA